MMVNKEDLFGRLQSLKNSFLFEKADYFGHFLDSAEQELEKKLKNVQKEKLESLLEMSVRTSTLISDPYFEDIICDLDNFTLIEKIYAL